MSAKTARKGDTLAMHWRSIHLSKDGRRSVRCARPGRA